MGIFSSFFRPKNVEKLKSKKDIDGSIKALNRKDKNIRTKAEEALGKTEAERAVGLLIQTLKGEKILTINVLAGMRSEKAVEGIILFLKQSEPSYIRMHAIDALDKIGDKRAIGPLVELIQEEDINLHMRAIEALEKLGWVPDNSKVEGLYWVRKHQWEKCAQIGEPAVEPLIEYILRYSGNSFVPMGDLNGAKKALAKIGTPVIDPLIKVLKTHVSKDAAWILGEIGDKRSVSHLIDSLGENPFVSIEAAVALGKIGDKRAIEPLRNQLRKAVRAAEQHFAQADIPQRTSVWDSLCGVIVYALQAITGDHSRDSADKWL